ncbi:MAG: hypothetical protein V1678_05325 [Candidatus Aenigmatarchaeota archaeon]
MHRLRILMAVFFVFLFFSFFLIGMPTLAATSVLVSAILASVGLFHLLSEMKVKNIGNIKIEEATFLRHFVFRSYTKFKNIWIVYDRRLKTFRAADFRDLPTEAGLTFLIGVALLYVSYMIISTLNQVPGLLVMRAIILIMFLDLGLYNFFVSLARFYSLYNKKAVKLCSILNKNRQLKGLIEKDKLSFEITPNFLLWNGFKTSVEIKSIQKFDSKPIEKYIVQVAMLIGKAR